jgi:hypothetical protein
MPIYNSKSCTAFRIYVGHPLEDAYERNQGVDGKMISNYSSRRGILFDMCGLEFQILSLDVYYNEKMLLIYKLIVTTIILRL